MQIDISEIVTFCGKRINNSMKQPSWLDHKQWRSPRWKCAIARQKLSMPMRVASDYLGFQTRPDYQLLDFGSGRGDDAKHMSHVCVTPYDPYWCDKRENIRLHDGVSLLYVVNVIENPAERIEVIQFCWEFTLQHLIIAVRTDGKGEVFTKSGTFQQYYTKESFASLLTQALGRVKITQLQPGVAVINK